jgi:hypothetical protein
MNNENICPNDQDEGRVWSIAPLFVAAERELSAFVGAVNDLFDAEQARQAAESWMEELVSMDWPGEDPATDWRRVTIAAATRLASRVKDQLSRNQ